MDAREGVRERVMENIIYTYETVKQQSRSRIIKYSMHKTLLKQNQKASNQKCSLSDAGVGYCGHNVAVDQARKTH